MIGYKMGEKSVIFEAEGGDGESRWSYGAAIFIEDANKICIEMDASYGGYQLHLSMSLDEVVDSSSRVCEKVRKWMSGRPGFPTEARLTIERFLTEELPAQLRELSNGEACAVCLMSLENGSPLKKLGCSHEFHRDCVDRWLVVCSNCPLCRHSILTEAHADDATTNYQGEFADIRNRILEIGILARRLREHSYTNPQPPEIDNSVSNARGFHVSTPILFSGMTVLLSGAFFVLQLLKPPARAPAPARAPNPSFSFSKFGLDINMYMK